MLDQVRLLPGAISELFAQASYSGQITLADRYGLMAAMLEEAIAEEERAAIDRILHAFYRGRMKVVSEISACPDGERLEVQFPFDKSSQSSTPAGNATQTSSLPCPEVNSSLPRHPVPLLILVR